jgi:hypothetical protein
MFYPSLEDVYEKWDEDGVMQDNLQNWREMFCDEEDLNEEECLESFLKSIDHWYSKAWDYLDTVEKTRTIYRMITVPKEYAGRMLEDLRKYGKTKIDEDKDPESIGVFWAYNPDFATTYWSKHNQEVFLEAEIDNLDKINIVDTYGTAMSIQDEEGEIRMFANQELKLTKFCIVNIKEDKNKKDICFENLDITIIT